MSRLTTERRIPFGLRVALPTAAPNTRLLASNGGPEGRTWDGTHPLHRGRRRIPTIEGARS